MANPTYSTFSAETQSNETLAQLALDLNWSWNHSGDDIWRQLDPDLWEQTGNPWILLQALPAKRLAGLDHPEFRARVEQLATELAARQSAPRWFGQTYPDRAGMTIAYFSMEYMLSEALPIYSGGLGNVAGDQLKAASDLGVPVTAIGLLYQRGYFRQEIDATGAQLALYPFNEPGQLPVRPVRNADGDWLRLPLMLSGMRVWLRTWQVQVGCARLYLLDTNDPANLPQHRGITSELYGGGPEVRLKQELVLGVGGWRLLRALGVQPDVCHLNEGHAAFAVLERAHDTMVAEKVSFNEALAITRAGNLFTTHTAVEAGFDRFPPELVRQYLAAYAAEQLGIGIDDLLALGRANSASAGEAFNMAYLAIRGSGAVNGVSRLHGDVSRRLFQPLYPRRPTSEIPVGHVTNGVHVPTWDSAGADKLWTEACGKGAWTGDLRTCAAVRDADDLRLWNMRTAGRKNLVQYVRERVEQQRTAQGASKPAIEQARSLFQFGTLTLGFARRFATYKRPTLLLSDPARLERILTNQDRPVQLVIAGKAHPMDQPGQALIRQWTDFLERPSVAGRVVLLQDYDMLLAERLVEGVDVWINTPRRPWEASGTSGMKVLVNGGLNLSVLDGWWAEAYTPEVGWAVGDGLEHDPSWDPADADALYRILEEQVIPEFYARTERGLPKAWIQRVRESMTRLTPEYSANRTVRQYTEQHYLPAAGAYAARADAAKRADWLAWRDAIARLWPLVKFADFRAETREGAHRFETALDLAGLDSSAVRVELFAVGGGGVMQPADVRPDDAATVRRYALSVPATRPISDFTARAMPAHPMALPVEIAEILWQR